MIQLLATATEDDIPQDPWGALVCIATIIGTCFIIWCITRN